MSILGVKKSIKNNDTLEMKKELLKMKSEIISINRKDRYLYGIANTLNIKVLDVENKVNNIRDTKIINISFTIGKENDNKDINFKNMFLFPSPGKIISFSILCNKNAFMNDKKYFKKGDIISSFMIVINYKETGILLDIINEENNFSFYSMKEVKVSFKKGDILSFDQLNYTPICPTVLITVIAEMDI